VAALAIAAGVAAWWATHRPGGASAGRGLTTIAILPFQNLGGDASTDYLRLALPDEIATTLSYVPTLAIRPFAATQKYAKGDVDPQAAGRELQVADVLTGHFQKEGDQLRVTLEVIDTENNRLLWRDTSSAAANDLIGLREQIASRLRQGLFPLLGGAPGGTESATRPKNAEAYDLYLRSKPLTSDPEPNDEAVAMLERSVGLDPDFAPAWAALSLRYYYQASYRPTSVVALGEKSAADLYARANMTVGRALSLDPNLVEAAQNSIVYETEGGDLEEADRRARDLVSRRPRDPEAHFALAYVLRYAGLLEDAARECDTALAEDPHNRGFRSCAFVFLPLGKHDRAREYLRLDAGSDWSKAREANILYREGKTEAAAAIYAATGFEEAAQLMRKSGTQADRDRISASLEAATLVDRDP
jgi:TolB-like protein